MFLYQHFYGRSYVDQTGVRRRKFVWHLLRFNPGDKVEPVMDDFCERAPRCSYWNKDEKRCKAGTRPGIKQKVEIFTGYGMRCQVNPFNTEHFEGEPVSHPCYGIPDIIPGLSNRSVSRVQRFFTENFFKYTYSSRSKKPRGYHPDNNPTLREFLNSNPALKGFYKGVGKLIDDTKNAAY